MEIKKVLMYFSICLLSLSVFATTAEMADAATPYKTTFWMYEGQTSVSHSLSLPDNGQKMYIAFRPNDSASYNYKIYRNGVRIVNDNVQGLMLSRNYSTPGTYKVTVTCISASKVCDGQGYLLRQ